MNEKVTVVLVAGGVEYTAFTWRDATTGRWSAAASEAAQGDIEDEAEYDNDDARGAVVEDFATEGEALIALIGALAEEV